MKLRLVHSDPELPPQTIDADGDKKPDTEYTVGNLESIVTRHLVMTCDGRSNQSNPAQRLWLLFRYFLWHEHVRGKALDWPEDVREIALLMLTVIDSCTGGHELHFTFSDAAREYVNGVCRKILNDL